MIDCAALKPPRKLVRTNWRFMAGRPILRMVIPELMGPSLSGRPVKLLQRSSADAEPWHRIKKTGFGACPAPDGDTGARRLVGLPGVVRTVATAMIATYRSYRSY